MGIKNALRKVFGGRMPTTATAEADVEEDPVTATSRATGGVAGHDNNDAQSTTGPGDSGPFVGRVSGDDAGPVGQTGAEARAEKDMHGTSGES